MSFMPTEYNLNLDKLLLMPFACGRIEKLPRVEVRHEKTTALAAFNCLVFHHDAIGRSDACVYWRT